MNASNQHSIAMLFLCAGASRRMGRSKALLPWNGSTVIGHHWQLFQQLETFEPWIVTQKNDEPLFAELNRLGWPEGRRVVNPIAPEGEMMDSIRCGIRGCLEGPYSGIGIALIDQPLIMPSTFKKLSDAVQENSGAILQPEVHGRRGHPVILPRKFAAQLLAGHAETLKLFLSENEPFRASVDVDDSGILTDLDTPEQYQHHLPLTA